MLQCLEIYIAFPSILRAPILHAPILGYSKMVIKIIFLMDNDNVCFSVFFFIVGCIITCICVQTRANI